MRVGGKGGRSAALRSIPKHYIRQDSAAFRIFQQNSAAVRECTGSEVGATEEDTMTIM